MLTSLTLANYRAYKEEQKFEFAIPSDDTLGLTVIVGPNNSGKSTPLKALKQLANPQAEFVTESTDRYEGLPPSIQLDFDAGEEEIQVKCGVVDEDYHPKKYFNDGRPAQGIPDLGFVKFIPSRRPWTSSYQYRKRLNVVDFEKEERERDDTQRTESRLGQALRGIEHNEDKEEFNLFLKQILSDFSDWRLTRLNGQDFISYVAKSGKVHPIDILGDGLASVFRICYTLFNSRPGDAIVLDEPELSLHPQSQQNLYNLIKELSVDRQIIVATHSQYFVKWADLSNGAKIIRVHQDSDGLVRVHTLSDQTIEQIKQIARADMKNRKLYDAVSKEVFFAHYTVFTEGPEDVHYIENYLEDAGMASLPLFGYGAGGAEKMIHWLRFAQELKIPAVGILDGDKSELAEQYRIEFQNDANIKIIVLPADDIRDKYKRNGRCSETGSCSETSEIHKKGVFKKCGEINDDMSSAFNSMLNQIYAHLGMPQP